MSSPLDARLFRRAVEFRVHVMAALASILLLFDGSAVRIGPGILTNPGHLPGNFHIRYIGPDSEVVIGDFLGDDGLRELSDGGQLIAEIAIEGFKPFWQLDDRLAAGVSGYGAVVDVLHLRRFDGGVREIFVGWIERMVYIHYRRGLITAILYENAALEIASIVKGDATQETFLRAPEDHNALAGESGSPGAATAKQTASSAFPCSISAVAVGVNA